MCSTPRSVGTRWSPGTPLPRETPPPAGYLATSPGGTASTTVPLALLPLQVEMAGVPLVGATVTLCASTCATGNDQYTLPTTDAYGITRTSVPYGTYSYSVKTAGSLVFTPTKYTLTLGASSISLTTTPALPASPFSVLYYGAAAIPVSTS